jgi:predicted Zn finger-like uncharacterized protein
MAMITRCPSCETTFRVHHYQLDARDGRVRCGRCAVVFDARLTLIPEVAPPADQAPAEEPAAAAPAPAEPEIEAAALRIDGPPSAPASQPPYSEPMRGARGASTLPPIDDREISYAEDEDDFEFGPHRRRRAVIATALWSAAVLALALVLASQAAYHFRSDVAAHAPELRGWLGRVCEALGCDVPLPGRASLVTIEVSEMQPDADAQGVLALSAVLRNRASFAQRQPWLELTLTDAQDRAVARRVLAPRDYLGPRAEFEPAFAAGAEQSLRLLLDVDTLPARGYRLLVFYP